MTSSSSNARDIRTTAHVPIANKDAITFEGIAHIDGDPDLSFALRGHAWNPMVDAAMPLIGLAIRVRRLHAYEHAQALYHTVRNQISAISDEIASQGYDTGAQLAFRYSLCAFVDEAVLSTSWGRDSTWAQRSLISVFHEETWGGEKFFTMLARMLSAPQTYKDVLEFMYLCLCLGFEGKYGLKKDSRDELQSIITRLHRVLRELRGPLPEQLTDTQANVASRHYQLGRQWPLWTPWTTAAGVLVVAYLLYAHRLHAITDQVVQALNSLLNTHT